MKQKSNEWEGLVVNLPEGDGLGVILEAHKLNKTHYQGTIVAQTGFVWIAKFKTTGPKIGEDIEYTEYTEYLTPELAERLLIRK